MTTATTNTPVLLEERDGVAIFTLNRPDVRNAVDRAMGEALAAALDKLDARDDLAVGILTGAGGTFCAGMDLKAFLAGENPSIEGRGLGGLTRATVRKPLVAAVEGWALGGGFELALSCDVIVAAEDAQFGLPEVKRGLFAGEGGVIRLPRRLPYHVAMNVLLTGEPLTATAAASYGLVTELASSGHALESAVALADRIKGNAPLALSAVKQVVRASDGVDETTAFAAQEPILERLTASEDVKEGASAFAEKRQPHWRGR